MSFPIEITKHSNNPEHIFEHSFCKKILTYVNVPNKFKFLTQEEQL